MFRKVHIFETAKKNCHQIILVTALTVVRMKGLEPPRPETSDPKSDAATITPHAQDFLVQR